MIICSLRLWGNSYWLMTVPIHLLINRCVSMFLKSRSLGWIQTQHFCFWKYLLCSLVSIDETFVTFSKRLTEIGLRNFLPKNSHYWNVFCSTSVLLLVLIILIFGYNYFRQPKDSKSKRKKIDQILNWVYCLTLND